MPRTNLLYMTTTTGSTLNKAPEWYRFPNSRMNKPPSLSSFLTNVSSGGARCTSATQSGTKKTTKSTTKSRTKQSNKLCWFYHHSPTGCTKGDACKFLHEKTRNGDAVLCTPKGTDVLASSTVAADTADETPVGAKFPEPGPRVDFSMYVGNIPPDFSDDDLRLLCKRVGTVNSVRTMRSKLRNGHRAGFVHMNSETQGEAAIVLINETSKFYANKERCVVCKDVSHKPRVTKDADGFQFSAGRTSFDAQTPNLSLVGVSRFALLDEEEENDNDEEEVDEEEEEVDEDEEEESDEEEENDDDEEEESNNDEEEVDEDKKTVMPALRMSSTRPRCRPTLS